MIEAALAFLLRNPLAAVLVVVLALLGAQTVRLNIAQANAAQARAEAAQARTAYQAAGATLERQNAAVRGLVALSKSLQSDLDKAAGAQRQMAAAHKKEVARLKAADVPQDCAGAVSWGAKEGRAIGAAFNEGAAGE